ncbi:hypothetical protein [Streptomyces sp. NPDC001450]
MHLGGRERGISTDNTSKPYSPADVSTHRDHATISVGRTTSPTHPIGSYEFCTRLLEQTGVMFTPGAAFGTLRTGLRLPTVRGAGNWHVSSWRELLCRLPPEGAPDGLGPTA